METQGEQPVAPESQENPDVESKLDALLMRTGDIAPEPEQETPVEEQPAEAQGEETTPETPTQEELEEIDYEGERYQVPKKLKDGFLRQSDYTKKTQEVAEARAFVALQVQHLQQEREFQNAVAPDMAALQQLEAAIKQYNGVDWSTLDTDTLVKTKHHLDTLKERKAEAEQAVQAKRGQFNQYVAKVQAEQAQKADEWLSKSIPAWSKPETKQEIAKAGLTEGFTEAEIAAVRDPRYVKVLWKAAQFDKLQAQKNTVTKSAQKAPPVIRPGSVPVNQGPQAQYKTAVTEMRRAKDPERKKALVDSVLDMKLKRLGM